MKNRRDFLVNAATASIAAAFSSLLPARSAFGQSPAATLTLHTDKVIAQMPADFVGLSYETSQLSEPDFFSSQNAGLIALFRLLSPNGVLRVGGDTSDFTWWQTKPGAHPPKLQHAPGTTDANWMPHELSPITPAAIDRLAGFLDATGWKLIYGLNLGSGTPRRAAEEAAYVFETMGARLLFFQIGNEPNLYHTPRNGLRPPDWGFSNYLTNWVSFANEVSFRVPGAVFGGPDCAEMMEWAPMFAQQAPPKKSGIVAVTNHYYAEGPPDDPTVNIERLLRPNSDLAANLLRVTDAARAAKLQYRMTEGNSCYRGGKPGMSDAFASSLWAADYMLQLAQAGCSGVNFHGGGAKQIRASLGGHLPGEKVATRPDAAASGSFYTPIAGDADSGFFPRPMFYGMMLASHFAGAPMIATDLDSQGANVTAYAAKTPKGFSIALLNKDADRDLQITVNIAGTAGSPVPPLANVLIWRLSGPALDATSGVTLGGAEVSPTGSWSATSFETTSPMSISTEGFNCADFNVPPPACTQTHSTEPPHRFTLKLPRASGALVMVT